MNDKPEPIQRKATETGPTCYVRINLSKTSKGWSHETTVSITWNDLVYPDREHSEPETHYVRRPDAWGDTMIDEPANLAVRNLLQMADAEARAEIARREAADAEWAKVTS